GAGDEGGSEREDRCVLGTGEHGGKPSARGFTPIADLAADLVAGGGSGMLGQLRRSYGAKDPSSAAPPGSRPVVKVGKRLRDDVPPKKTHQQHRPDPPKPRDAGTVGGEGKGGGG
ncbi:unnamed protein product, partial [Scytosiphon promiscuus]